MKKLIPAILVLLLAAAVAFFLLKRQTRVSQEITTLLPSDTVLLIHVPDVKRTRERWKETALFKIHQEPEVQAFLERPLSRIPRNESWNELMGDLARVQPNDLFTAITSVQETVPKIVGGFEYQGKKTDVEAVMAKLKSRIQAAQPTGRSDVQMHEGATLETFSTASGVIASVVMEDWVFVSNDIDLLKATLDRHARRNNASPLRENSRFKTAVEKVPTAYDFLVFAQPKPVLERVTALMASSGQALSPAQLEELRKLETMVFSTKLEGENIRDVAFFLMSGMEKFDAMPRNALAISSEETLLYYAARLMFPATMEWPPATGGAGAAGMDEFVNTIRRSFESQGLTLADFSAAFGPEFSTLLDWPAMSQQPGLLLTLDVKDAAKARQFVDAFANSSVPSMQWASQTIDGIPFYGLTSAGFAMVTPTMALTDRFLVFGLSTDSVRTAIGRQNGNAPQLSKTAGYGSATGLVKEPTNAFGYIDSKTLFERVYGTFRPFVMMWSAFTPKANEYADLTKLPATETISKHLKPIILSQTALPDGMLVESVGPITFNQAAIGIVAGAVGAAVPILKNQALNPGNPGAAAAPPAVAPSGASPSPMETIPAPEPTSPDSQGE
jgi:hypothetical protein